MQGGFACESEEAEYGLGIRISGLGLCLYRSVGPVMTRAIRNTDHGGLCRDGIESGGLLQSSRDMGLSTKLAIHSHSPLLDLIL